MNSNFRTSVGTPTFESKYLEKESELKALRLENLELKNSVKMKDLEIKERDLKNTRTSLVDSTQVKELKLALDSKDKIIKEYEKKVKELEEKCQELEQDKLKALELADSMKNTTNSNNVTKTTKVSEEFYKKKVENLTEEVFLLKRQLEESSNISEMMKLELESEVSQLKIENSGLMKQKKTEKNEKAGPLNLRNNNKNDDFINNNSEILNLKEEVKNLDNEKKNLDGENKKLGEKMMEKDREIKEIRERMIQLEDEVQRTKLKLAEILNVAFETGGAELVELIESAIIDQRLSINK